MKWLATDRFGVLGQEVRQVEVQPDGTVGLLLEGGVVVISADDYDRILDLQLPGGQWPRRRGRLPEAPGSTLIGTAEAAQLLGVSARKMLDWLHTGVYGFSSSWLSRPFADQDFLWGTNDTSMSFPTLPLVGHQLYDRHTAVVQMGGVFP